MNPQDFIKAVLRTDLKPDSDMKAYDPISERLYFNDDNVRLLHASMGMTGEAGEISEHLKKWMMYGKELNHDKLKEECGDVLWYMGIMLDQLGSSFEEVMQMNADKLARRYPDGFTEEAAIERKDKK